MIYLAQFRKQPRQERRQVRHLLRAMYQQGRRPIEPGTMPEPPTAADIARLLELAPRYGVTIELPAGHQGAG